MPTDRDKILTALQRGSLKETDLYRASGLELEKFSAVMTDLVDQKLVHSETGPVSDVTYYSLIQLDYSNVVKIAT